MPLFDDTRLVVLDIETTGHNIPDKSWIERQPKGWRAPGIAIEIGCIEILREGNEWIQGKKWHSLINPEGPISPRAIKIHGIRPGSLARAPRFAGIYAPFKEFIADSRLVAHSWTSDCGYLEYEFGRCRVPSEEWANFAERGICTQELYNQLYPNAPKSLDAVCDRLWIDRSDRFVNHGAMLDAELTMEVFIELGRRIQNDNEPLEARRFVA